MYDIILQFSLSLLIDDNDNLIPFLDKTLIKVLQWSQLPWIRSLMK